MMAFVRPLILITVLALLVMIYMQYQQLNNLRQQLSQKDADSQLLKEQLISSQNTLQHMGAIQQTQIECTKTLQNKLDTAQRAKRTAKLETQIHAAPANLEWGRTPLPIDVASLLHYPENNFTHLPKSPGLSASDAVFATASRADHEPGSGTGID